MNVTYKVGNRAAMLLILQTVEEQHAATEVAYTAMTAMGIVVLNAPDEVHASVRAALDAKQIASEITEHGKG